MKPQNKILSPTIEIAPQKKSEFVTIDDVVKLGIKLTPMMEQYYNIKSQYPGILLLFRMGDFYEVFFEDARTASRILGITLTHRGKLGDIPVPMAGIPHHAAMAYVDRLTNVGLRVAICEQIQDPKDAQGIVERAVTQIVSPGLPYDIERDDQAQERYILCAYSDSEQHYLVALDFTTGAFKGHIAKNTDDLINTILRYPVREFVHFPNQWEHLPQLEQAFAHLKTFKTCIRSEYFELQHSKVYIEKIIPNYKHDDILKQHKNILAPIGALAYYICTTQSLDSVVHLNPFALVADQDIVRVSAQTLMGLEIIPRTRQQYRDSILGYLDHCQTPMGPRLLHQFFLAPLRKQDDIEKRLKWVEHFHQQSQLIDMIKNYFEDVRDIDRICAKLSTKKINSSDLLNLAKSLTNYFKVLELLGQDLSPPFEILSKSKLAPIHELINEIAQTINCELGATLEKGNLILSGANKSRDRLAGLAQDADSELLKLEEKYRQDTGISKLRIKSNNIAGYFVEVSKGQVDKVPKSFVRRQTLVNAERFITTELEAFQKDVLSAKAKLERIEKEIFNTIVLKVAESIASIKSISFNIAALDVFQSLAYIALKDKMSRATFMPKERMIKLKGAWHPLIKAKLHEEFVAHDLILDEKQFFGLITGPNMAGKTTVMREVAICQFLAQIGSFIPAKEACLGLVDQIFSRLGASDDIQKGQSTFMVEMTETAQILRHATKHSLIILDEVGRGTSTYDGLSIAWALVEYFVAKVGALTLFATHYHELIELAQNLPQAKNLTVKTVTQDDDVHFLYQLVEEGATQSYGLYVAKLAGLPTSVLKKAREVLEIHEKNQLKKNGPIKTKAYQLSFFEHISAPVIPEYLCQVEQELATLDLYNITPIDAMVKLRQLQEKILH